jgi:hypothetical protein
MKDNIQVNNYYMKKLIAISIVCLLFSCKKSSTTAANNNNQDDTTQNHNDTTTNSNPTDTLLKVGDRYGGGIIFYVYTNYGSTDTSLSLGQHGLVCALTDQSDSATWWNMNVPLSNLNISAIQDGLFAGMYNTKYIIAVAGTGNYAASICANYNGGGYNDWYLPSLKELTTLSGLIFTKDSALIKTLGFNTTGYYWSSTISVELYGVQFGVTDPNQDDFISSAIQQLYHVRAIRAF